MQDGKQSWPDPFKVADGIKPNVGLGAFFQAGRDFGIQGRDLLFQGSLRTSERLLRGPRRCNLARSRTSSSLEETNSWKS